MQAKLPDINGALVRHRNAIMNAYDSGDFTKAGISFEATIALLPEEYKVEINTEKYNQLVKDRYKIVCTGCMMNVQYKVDDETRIKQEQSEFPRSEIKPFEVLVPDIERLITGKKTVLVWQCPSCGIVKPLKGSPTKLIKFHQPSYFKVIPDIPSRKGFFDRTGFDTKFKEWYDIAFSEIESQIGLYRAEYAQQQEMNDEDLPDE